MYIYLFHWLIVAPLFVYIGLMKEKTPANLFNLLLAMGVVVFVYHFQRWYTVYGAQKIKNIY